MKLFILVSQLLAIGLVFGANPKPKDAAQLSIATKGSELAFDTTALSVRVSQPVALTFTNRASAGSGMKHNWVLVQTGKQAEAAARGVAAGESKDYVENSPAVLAHTRLLKPGESQTIRFQAPSTPGDYPYLCTVPGHSELLKGTLKVTP